MAKRNDWNDSPSDAMDAFDVNNDDQYGELDYVFQEDPSKVQANAITICAPNVGYAVQSEDPFDELSLNTLLINHQQLDIGLLSREVQSQASDESIACPPTPEPKQAPPILQQQAGTSSKGARGRPPSNTHVKLKPARPYNPKPESTRKSEEYLKKRERNNKAVRQTRTKQKEQTEKDRQRIDALEKKVDILIERIKTLEEMFEEQE